MTLIAPRTAVPPTPDTRARRLLALAVPGALLCLCSAGVVAMATSPVAHAIHLLVAQR